MDEADEARRRKAYHLALAARIDKPGLKECIKNLDPEHVLGMDNAPRGVPCYDEFMTFKRRYPGYVVLLQVGKFYEAAGYDALALCQFNDNRLTNHESPDSVRFPRAGSPVASVCKVLENLVVVNGLRVVVVNETGTALNGRNKLRNVAGTVTPERPIFEPGPGDVAALDASAQAAMVTALVAEKRGLKVMQLDPNAGPDDSDVTVYVRDSLSPEAAATLMLGARVAAPLYVHDSVHDAAITGAFSSPTAVGGVVEKICALSAQSIGAADKLQKVMFGSVGDDHVASWQEALRASNRLVGQTPTLKPVRTASARPVVYLSTLQQLGLTAASRRSGGLRLGSGIPSLLDATLHDAAPLLVVEWMRLWLTDLPPHAVADALAVAGKALDAAVDEGVPYIELCDSPLRLWNGLSTGNASDDMLRKLHSTLGAVHSLLTSSKATVGGALPGVLRAAEFTRTKQQDGTMERAELATAVQHVLDTMHGILNVAPREDADRATLRAYDFPLPDDASVAKAGQHAPALAAAQRDSIDAALRALAAEHEGWRAWVTPAALGNKLAQFEDAKKELRRGLHRALCLTTQAAHHSSSSSTAGIIAEYSPGYDAIHISANFGSKKNAVTLSAFELAYAQGTTNKGKGKAKARSSHVETAELQDLVEDYKQMAAGVRTEALEALQLLCKRLQVHRVPIERAVWTAVVWRALDSHVRAAQRRGWVWPQVAAAGPQDGRAALAVRGMWPYWFERAGSPAPVLNSISLDGVALLTGPNMAGKSTVLRGLASVALLAAAGLKVPAEEAHVPAFSHIILRNFSGDSPLEGKSAFAVEMDEVASLYSDCRASHRARAASLGSSSAAGGPSAPDAGGPDAAASGVALVLLDELGKGTEVTAATAIVSTIVRRLVHLGSMGMLATHLHDVIERTAQLHADGRLAHFAMDTETDSTGHLSATHRVVADAVCRESLAFKVMADASVAADVVEEAQREYEEMRAHARHRQQLEEEAAAGRPAPSEAPGGGQGGRAGGAASSTLSPAGQPSNSRDGSSSGTSTTHAASAAAGPAAAAAQVEDAAEASPAGPGSEGEDSDGSDSGSGSGSESAAGAGSRGARPRNKAVEMRAVDEVVAAEVARRMEEWSRTGQEARTQAWLEHPLRINRLASDEQPPASASASHQVYVLRLYDDMLYVGESAGADRRFREHRTTHKRRRERLFTTAKKAGKPPPAVHAVPVVEVSYFKVPMAAGAESCAKELETLLIAALRRAGYALYNKDEGRRGTTRADSTSRPNNPE